MYADKELSELYKELDEAAINPDKKVSTSSINVLVNLEKHAMPLPQAWMEVAGIDAATKWRFFFSLDFQEISPPVYNIHAQMYSLTAVS